MLINTEHSTTSLGLDDLDFDFFTDLLDVMSENPESDKNTHNAPNRKAVKSNLTKAGRKLCMGKSLSKPRSFRKGMTVTQAITAHGPMPNMSRRAPTNVLVAFPVFDKCDSLVYFPHSYVRHLNCGDVESTAKLIYAHADKECRVKYTCGGEACAFTFTLENLNFYLKISEELEPDRIMCVHSTKVIDNQIRAEVYIKLTDSQTIYSSVCGYSDVPELQPYISRADRFQFYSKQPDLQDEVRQDILTHSRTNEDVLIYMRMELVLTFDHKTRKIICIETDYTLTSMHSAHISPAVLVD